MPPVEVHIGEMAARVLSAKGSPDADRLAVLLPRAVHFYLDERDGERVGWRYPSFLDEGRAQDDGRQVNLPEDLWQQLRAEAERQEVSPEDLLQHATFYYGAARVALARHLARGGVVVGGGDRLAQRA